MFKVILTLLFSLVVSYAETKRDYYKELLNMDSKYRVNILVSYVYGSQHDLGLTLAAINWKESGGGLYPVNITDGKYGSFSNYHILLENVISHYNAKTPWEMSRLAEKLIYDEKFAVDNAIRIFNSFKSSKCNYLCQVASYNAGYLGIKSPKGLSYANDIVARTKAIDKYLTNFNLKSRLEVMGYMLKQEKQKLAKLSINTVEQVLD